MGTAQFGLSYGITNTGGRVPFQEVERILTEAKFCGVGVLDTAAAYGNCEQVLGEIGVGDFQIVSKLAPLPERVDDVSQWVEEQARASLQRLRVPKLKALLLHKPSQILEPRGSELVMALERVKREGFAEKIGYSMYDPSEWYRYRDLMQADAVQVPVNPIDQRWKVSGALQEMKQEGIEIHVRSVFMQGLLIAKPKASAEYFRPWAGVFDAWRQSVQESGLNAASRALAFARALPGVRCVVVGVTTKAEFCDLVRNYAVEPRDLPPLLDDYDIDLIRPEKWPQACT